MSVDLDEADTEGPPPLINVVVTRRVRGQVLGTLALVDRTCLGIKDANLLPLQPEQALRDFVAEVLRPMGELRECQAIEAQSVLFHALDYATSLGFAHDGDFDSVLVEPRPEALLETPLAHPARPLYVSGPHDAFEEIIQRLELAVGAGNYDFMGGFARQGSFDFGDGEFELGLDDEGYDEDGMAEEGTIETTAESAEEERQ